MLAFILFALLFHYWLFVVIGFHYCLMFAMVFYQLSLDKKEKLSMRVVFSAVTPFIYIFDFCVNCLSGPTSYWYVMVYVPIYCENVLMSALGLWHASSSANPAWCIVPGCVAVIVMFPLGVLAQLAYYRYWHPQNAPSENSDGDRPSNSQPWLQLVPWKTFLADIEKASGDKKHSGEGISGTPRPSRHSVVTGEQEVDACKGPFTVTAVRSAEVRTRTDARRHARVRTYPHGTALRVYPYRRVCPYPPRRPTRKSATGRVDFARI